MDRLMKDGIEYIGVTKNLPREAKLFGEVCFYDTVDISNIKDPLKSIVSATIDCNIISWKIIDTIKGRCNDGTNLLGNKVIVDGEYTLKIQYISDSIGKTVFSTMFKYSKFGEITVPPKINGENIKDLNRRKKLRITPYVEDLYVCIAGKNRININMNVVLNLECSI